MRTYNGMPHGDDQVKLLLVAMIAWGMVMVLGAMLAPRA